MDFAPSGEYLATSHMNSKAVHLWSSKAFFQQVVIQKVPTKAIPIDLPTSDATKAQKYSHKDFYNSSMADKIEAHDANSQSLIQQKLAKLGTIIDKN